MFTIDGILHACLPALCNLVVQTMQARGWQVRHQDRPPSLKVVLDLDCSGLYYNGRIEVKDKGGQSWCDCVSTLVHEITHHYDGSPVDLAAIRRLNRLPGESWEEGDWEEYRNFPWEVKAREIEEELRETACAIAAKNRLEQIKSKTGRHYRAEKSALLQHLRYGGRELGAFNWRNWRYRIKEG